MVRDALNIFHATRVDIMSATDRTEWQSNLAPTCPLYMGYGEGIRKAQIQTARVSEGLIHQELPAFRRRSVLEAAAQRIVHLIPGQEEGWRKRCWETKQSFRKAGDLSVHGQRETSQKTRGPLRDSGFTIPHINERRIKRKNKRVLLALIFG